MLWGLLLRISRSKKKRRKNQGSGNTMADHIDELFGDNNRVQIMDSSEEESNTNTGGGHEKTTQTDQNQHQEDKGEKLKSNHDQMGGNHKCQGECKGPVEGSSNQNQNVQRDTSSNEVTTIRELATDESISGVLRYCKLRILLPLFRLLGLMGLKPLQADRPDLCTCSIMLNKMHLIFVILLFFAGYFAQYFTCFRRDCGFSYKDDVMKISPDSIVSPLKTICLGNPIFTHIVPSGLHLLSFFYMLYLYRFTGDEQLQNLMERVFIQASLAHSTFISQKRLLRTLQVLVTISVLWLFFSTASLILQITTHDIFYNIWVHVKDEVKYGIIVALVISTVWQDAVQVTVIVSYSIHCYLLSNYLDLLQSRIKQHSITLNECIKEIGELGKLLTHLNDDLGPGLGPLIILDSAFSISNIVFLMQNARNMNTFDLVALSINATLWLCLVLFPLHQAAKLSSTCKRIRELGHLVRMRPFGYQSISQSDLDSFLLFVSTLKLEVKILKIPVSQKIIMLTLIMLIFALFLWGLILS